MDKATYTRLDQFLSLPGLFEEWCEQQIPRIQEGGYDFVIIQTLSWTNMRPEQHERLCAEIIQQMVEKITGSGAKVILYDKFLKPEVHQQNPRARTWCGRYSEGYKLNYLLHIMAAKNAPGIVGATFGGQAITEKWNEKHYDRLGVLFADTSHPGPIADYISALNMAYLLTGEKPVGSPVRELPLSELRARWFRRLPTSNKPGAQEVFEENKDRAGEGVLTLRADEALDLQEAAWRSQSEWGTLLSECLADDGKYAEVEKEIRRIHGEMCNYEAWGLHERTIAALKERFAPPAAPGELPPRLVEAIRSQSRSIDHTGARKYYRKFFEGEKKKQVQKEYADYWQENNSKLRDDIFCQCRVLEEKALRSGDRDEAGRLQMSARIINYVLALPGFRIVIEHANEEQPKTILAGYEVKSWETFYSPKFAAYQKANHLDKDKLFKGWEVYLDIWEDPDLMDRFRDNDYRLDIFKEVDEEFAKRIVE